MDYGKSFTMQEKQKSNQISTTVLLIAALGIMRLLNATSSYLKPNLNFILKHFGSLDNYKNFADILGVKITTCTILISVLFNIFIRKTISDKITKMYPKSTIIYKYCPLLFIGLFAQLFIGYGIGTEIIPSFLFFEHLQQNTNTYLVLIIHILLAASAFVIFMIFASYSIVLTNREILTIMPFVKRKTKTISISNHKES